MLDWLDDWDDASVCGNPNRERARAWGHKAPQESPLLWRHNFHDGLDMWVASPYALAGRYKLPHGGAHGDSQGVGCFSKISKKRAEYHQHILREGLSPRTNGPVLRTKLPTSRGGPRPPMAPSPRLHQRRPPPLLPHGVGGGLANERLRSDVRGGLWLSTDV